MKQQSTQATDRTADQKYEGRIKNITVDKWVSEDSVFSPNINLGYAVKEKYALIFCDEADANSKLDLLNDSLDYSFALIENVAPETDKGKQVEGFTGGEWKIDAGRTPLGDTGDYMPYMLIIGDKLPICSMSEHFPDEETEANARLIAKAPDMYRALQELVEACEFVGSLATETKQFENAKAIINTIQKH